MPAKLIAPILGLFLSVSPVFGAVDTQAPISGSESPPQPDCSKTPCRPAKTITLRLSQDRTVDLRLDPSPYSDERGAIKAYPGDMLVFHVSADGESLKPVFVREENLGTGDVSQLTPQQTAALDNKDPNTPALRQGVADMKTNGTMKDRLANAPPGTLLVDFRQIPGGLGMILETGHNFPQALKFDATITYTNGRSEHSSTCVVLPKLGGIETWPGPLVEIVLANIRLVPVLKDANGNFQMSCD